MLSINIRRNYRFAAQSWLVADLNVTYLLIKNDRVLHEDHLLIIMYVPIIQYTADGRPLYAKASTYTQSV